jgi:hypothetical protein
MPTLFLKCRTCAVDFPTPIAVTDGSVHGQLMISGMEHVCPSCGARDKFFTADYFIPTSGLAVPVDAPAPMDAPAGVERRPVPADLPISSEPPAGVAASTATIGGDPGADHRAELETVSGRLAGYNVQGTSEHHSEGPAPPYDSQDAE